MPEKVGTTFCLQQLRSDQLKLCLQIDTLITLINPVLLILSQYLSKDLSQLTSSQPIIAEKTDRVGRVIVEDECLN